MDNRSHQESDWDFDLLAIELLDLRGLNLDLDLTGFDAREIDSLLFGAEDDERADLAPALPEHPVTLPGDVWICGPHRVLCGDALASEGYAKLMGGTQASMVFTDPPYNVPIDGHATGLGKIHHPEFLMAAGEMSEAEFADFLAGAFRLSALNSREGSIHFVCMDWRHMLEILTAGGHVYDELKNLCVWTKDNADMGSFYRSQHELVFVFKKGKSPHRNNVQLGQFGRYRSNVWQYPGANSFSRSSNEGNLLA